MAKNKYKRNSRKKAFINSIPTISLDDENNNLTIRCKFNFSYFTIDSNVGEDFNEWSHNELVKLLNKLKNFSQKSLKDWENETAGKYPVFVKYDSFPPNTDFDIPKHIPHQAIWSRFHLENKARLIGFVIPDEYKNKIHPVTKEYFDTNTFYVVFLDKEHKFYKTEH